MKKMGKTFTATSVCEKEVWIPDGKTKMLFNKREVKPVSNDDEIYMTALLNGFKQFTGEAILGVEITEIIHSSDSRTRRFIMR